MRKLQIIILFLISAFQSKGQDENCILQPPAVTIDFGSGDVTHLNSIVPARYERVASYCPSDGHYAYTPNTSGCFRGDWFELNEDHTAGDRNGNMLLVNSSYRTGGFLSTSISGLKANTKYEFGVWMMNVCRITDKCPFPLLPDITIHLQTPEGKNVAQLSIGELRRVQSPKWSQFQFRFTSPASGSTLMLVMVNHAPGGCGNDFVIDDISFRECIIRPPSIAKKTTTAAKKQPVAATPAVKKKVSKPVTKSTPKPVSKSPGKPIAKSSNKQAPRVAGKPVIKPLSKTGQRLETATPKPDSSIAVRPAVKQRSFAFPPAPPVLRNRTNLLVKRIETGAGKIKVDLYDNGEIDDDTVTIYHNNRILTSRARLSQKPITFHIAVDEAHPHHELTMVAENLGSIPPNTSLMVVTAGDKRHEVFISSTKQKNAKVVFDLE